MLHATRCLWLWLRRLRRCVYSSVGKYLTHMNLPASEVATPPPSTVHSSEYGSSWDPLLLSETGASGSDDSPCRAIHLLTYPRDGRLPSHDATGPDDFPAKPVVTMWEGIDEMGPWLRVKETDRLLLGDRTVHWSPNCPFLSGGSFGLTLYVTVPTSYINVFIMMLTTTSVYMATIGAMEIWTLWQESSGLWLLCVGGAAHFR